MSSISANPNPNPKPSVIVHPPPPNPPDKSAEIKCKKKRNSKNQKKKKRNPKNKRKPNWLELPEDVWFLILSKLKTIDIIENVQKVCTLFRNLSKHPSMFKAIDMYLPDAFNCLPYDVNLMIRYAVDRSAGQLDDIYLDYLCDDETLMYIAERSPNLRHLRLGQDIFIGDEGLIEAVQKLPMLEEVQLIICSFSDKTVEALGCALPRLKSFSLTQVGSKKLHFLDDEDALLGNEEALAIAKSMPELRHLQLIGNYMTNVGLQAILDGCPLLESLDLRACFRIDLSRELGQRCKALKHLRLPHDSTKDYGRQAYAEQEGFGYICEGQECVYDSDGFSLYPGFNDFMGPWDEYSDYFDDDDEFALCYDYAGPDGILDYSSSDY